VAEVRAPGPVLVGCALAVAAAAFWVAFTPAGILRQQLHVAQFWSLEALLIVAVVTGWAGLRELTARLMIRRADLYAPAGSALLAGLLVFAGAPETNRIYYDEQIYQSIGQNFSDLHLAQMCNEGIVEYGRLQCLQAEYNKQPYGYPHLLSVGYRLFGVSARLAHRINGASAVVLPLVIYLLTLALFSDRRAAAFAALAAAIIPQQILWSHTAASEPTSALAAAWAVLALAAFIRLRSGTALAWLVTAFAYAVQFRPEMPLLVVPVGAALALLAPAEIRDRRAWIAGLATLLLCAVAAAHLVAVRGEGWGTSGDRLSFAFFVPNLRVNGWFYLWDARFPVMLTVLALFGAARARSRQAAVIVLWFVAFSTIYLLFYAGSFNYGADIRYSLLTYPPLMVLAGVGAASLAGWIDRHPLGAGMGARVVAAGLLAQTLWYLPTMRAVGEEAWAARADVAFAQAMSRTLPRNALVLTHNPGMFHLWGINAAQLSLAVAQPGYVRGDLQRRYAGGIFIHWNFWCNVSDPVQNAFCRDVLASFDTQLIAEYRERHYRYALYRIRPPLTP